MIGSKEMLQNFFRGESTYEDEVFQSTRAFRTVSCRWMISGRWRRIGVTARRRLRGGWHLRQAYGQNQGAPMETLAAEDFRPGGSGGGRHRGVVLQSVQ